MCLLTDSSHDIALRLCEPPNPTKIVTSSKAVRFGRVSVQEPNKIHHLDQDQIESMWYTDEEKDEIRKRIRRAIRSTKDGKYCLRGLEFAIDTQRPVDQEDKRFSILDLQDYNVEFGANSWKGLKALSLSLSRNDRQRAVQQAFDDAEEASRIYKETMNTQLVDKCFQ